MRPRLLVLSGPLKDSTVLLAEGEVTIGREASNGIAVIDPSVSRKHCALLGRDGKFQVRDLDSRNGTLVNGLVVQEQWLQHGDEIAAGDSSFLFLLEDHDVPTPGRVEFEDGQRTAETTVIDPKDVVYLQPDRLLRELPASSHLARNLNALLKISRIVHAIRDLDDLQGQLLDLIFEVVPAGRGAILLADREGHQFNSLFARTRQSAQPQLVNVSRTVARQVLEQGIAILGTDVPSSGDLRAVESLVADAGSLSPMCAPDGVSAGHRLHLSRQQYPGQPAPRRASSAGDGNRGHIRNGAGECAPPAVAGTGKRTPDDRGQPGAKPGRRRRADETDLPVSEARSPHRLNRID